MSIRHISLLLLLLFLVSPISAQSLDGYWMVLFHSSKKNSSSSHLGVIEIKNDSILTGKDTGTYKLDGQQIEILLPKLKASGILYDSLNQFRVKFKSKNVKTKPNNFSNNIIIGKKLEKVGIVDVDLPSYLYDVYWKLKSKNNDSEEVLLQFIDSTTSIINDQHEVSVAHYFITHEMDQILIRIRDWDLCQVYEIKEGNIYAECFDYYCMAHEAESREGHPYSKKILLKRQPYPSRDEYLNFKNLLIGDWHGIYAHSESEEEPDTVENDSNVYLGEFFEYELIADTIISDTIRLSFNSDQSFNFHQIGHYIYKNKEKHVNNKYEGIWELDKGLGYIKLQIPELILGNIVYLKLLNVSENNLQVYSGGDAPIPIFRGHIIRKHKKE